jgi:hypothetical protein
MANDFYDKRRERFLNEEPTKQFRKNAMKIIEFLQNSIKTRLNLNYSVDYGKNGGYL